MHFNYDLYAKYFLENLINFNLTLSKYTRTQKIVDVKL